MGQTKVYRCDRRYLRVCLAIQLVLILIISFGISFASILVASVFAVCSVAAAVFMSWVHRNFSITP